MGGTVSYSQEPEKRELSSQEWWEKLEVWPILWTFPVFSHFNCTKGGPANVPRKEESVIQTKITQFIKSEEAENRGGNGKLGGLLRMKASFKCYERKIPSPFVIVEFSK